MKTAGIITVTETSGVIMTQAPRHGMTMCHFPTTIIPPILSAKTGTQAGGLPILKHLRSGTIGTRAVPMIPTARAVGTAGTAAERTGDQIGNRLLDEGAVDAE